MYPTSLDWDDDFSTEGSHVHRACSWSRAVGANKNSIKIIGTATNNYAQGYFVYDSKKSGARTVSHLRFSPKPIRGSYLISQAQFVACHNFAFLEQFDMLSSLQEGGVFLLNSPYSGAEVWDRIPREVQQQIIDKKARFYVMTDDIARAVGLGGRINVIMQAASLKISACCPEERPWR